MDVETTFWSDVTLGKGNGEEVPAATTVFLFDHSGGAPSLVIANRGAKGMEMDDREICLCSVSENPYTTPTKAKYTSTTRYVQSISGRFGWRQSLGLIRAVENMRLYCLFSWWCVLLFIVAIYNWVAVICPATFYGSLGVILNGTFLIGGSLLIFFWIRAAFKNPGYIEKDKNHPRMCWYYRVLDKFLPLPVERLLQWQRQRESERQNRYLGRQRQMLRNDLEEGVRRESQSSSSNDTATVMQDDGIIRRIQDFFLDLLAAGDTRRYTAISTEETMIGEGDNQNIAAKAAAEYSLALKSGRTQGKKVRTEVILLVTSPPLI